ncbi:hypothetical protein JB92DRAFT_756360 [Gautieria morchelliformis]|nr:hypothetical protein JB92DRAFT_756360 [Gautieria morchelliformis]
MSKWKGTREHGNTMSAAEERVIRGRVGQCWRKREHKHTTVRAGTRGKNEYEDEGESGGETMQERAIARRGESARHAAARCVPSPSPSPSPSSISSLPMISSDPPALAIDAARWCVEPAPSADAPDPDPSADADPLAAPDRTGDAADAYAPGDGAELDASADADERGADPVPDPSPDSADADAAGASPRVSTGESEGEGDGDGEYSASGARSGLPRTGACSSRGGDAAMPWAWGV